MATLLVLIAVGSLPLGCSRRPASGPWPVPRPLAAEYASPAQPGVQTATATLAAATSPRSPAPQASTPAPDAGHDARGDSPADPTGDLTLASALELALKRNPTLIACAHEVAAEEARALQSGLWRNPELDLRRDRLGSTEVDGSKDSPRTRIILSQVLELGGAPGRRRDVGHAESQIAAWDCEVERLQVAGSVVRAFAAVLGAQAKLDRLEEDRTYVEEVQRDVVARVACGEMPERRLAQMVRHCAAAEIALRRGEGDLAAARQELAATWGGNEARFEELAGRLEELPSLPDTAQVRAAVDHSPGVSRWSSEIERARAEAQLARAEAWPEVRLDAGMRHEDETDVSSYLLGLQLSLPLFDRAQGDRSAAGHDLAAATARQAAARAEVSVEAMTLYQNLVAAHFAACTLREKIIPAATEEFVALQRGYAENAVSVADLLDSARDVSRATLDCLDALTECYQALADLEGLTGEPLAAPATPLGQPSMPEGSR